MGLYNWLFGKKKKDIIVWAPRTHTEQKELEEFMNKNFEENRKRTLQSMRENIPCKNPYEIYIQYMSYKTREQNLQKRWDNMNIQTGTNAMTVMGMIQKLQIKIALMENILKLDK